MTSLTHKRRRFEQLECRHLLTTVFFEPQAILEGDGEHTAQIEFTLDEPATQTMQLQFVIEQGTAKYGDISGATVFPADADFERVSSQQVTFSAGETSETFDLTILGDTTYEFDETIIVRMFSTTNGLQLGHFRGVITLVNDEVSVPDAIFDQATTSPDVPIDIDVAANDVGGADILSISQPITEEFTPAGSTVLNADGTVAFSPEAGFAGTATFSYTVAEDLAMEPIVASDATKSDWFGRAVDIDGVRAIVGAKLDDDGQDRAGSAYVYFFDGSQWTEEAKLTAPSPGENDQFGNTVGISGDTIVVGAWLANATNGSNSGASYVYQRDSASGNWSLVKQLLGSDTSPADHFGVDVDIDGDKIIVGADLDDPAGSASGAAYVFERNSGGTNQWGETHKLVPSFAQARDHFGEAVAVSGNSFVVGARFDDHSFGTNAGSAYVFDIEGGVVTETILRGFDTGSGDQFGNAVDIDENWVVVGAWLEDLDEFEVPKRSNSGALYLFSRHGYTTFNREGPWVQEAHLRRWTFEDQSVYPTGGDRLGASVAIDGMTIVSSSGYIDTYSNGERIDNSGSAYVFAPSERNSGNWLVQRELTHSNLSKRDRFGTAIAIDNGRAIIGAPLEDLVLNAGAAYIANVGFDRTTVAVQVEGPLAASLAFAVDDTPHDDTDEPQRIRSTPNVALAPTRAMAYAHSEWVSRRITTSIARADHFAQLVDDVFSDALHSL